MKQGTTPTLEFKLDIEISNVTKVYFTFTDELKYKGTSEDDTPSYLLQKNYPDDATFEDDTFKLPLSQEETDLLTNTFFVEAQVICGTAVVKSDIKKVNMPHTLWTTYVDDNESDGQSEVIHLSFSDYVKVEGGGSSNYNDLTNKPKINNIELINNKTSSDLGLANASDLNSKADKSDTYTKSETNNLLSGKQNTITGGNGINVSSDVVSVDIKNYTTKKYLKFTDGKLDVNLLDLGKTQLRTYLTTDYQELGEPTPLVNKTYVDNLISGRLKRLVVESLPTQDIDTNTIYMVLKSVPSTNNIYDEYMYINGAWELIGTTEVDLSNYYTKTETYSKSEVDTALGNKQNTLTQGNGINIDTSADTISVRLLAPQGIINYLAFTSGGMYIDTYSLSHDRDFRIQLTSDYYDNPLQPKLTAGTNITIDSNNVISASGGLYTFTDGLKESSGTVGIDLASGSKLLIDANDKLDVDLSSKQDTIDSRHKLDADLVDDSTSTNQFVTSTEKSTWNGKADNTTITTDTSSTTVSLTLADNHEYRYTQELTSLTLTLPLSIDDDFISSVVFKSGSTATQMTYDSSIKWSGEDVTSNAFVPQANMEYEIVFWYNGLSVNAVVRGVA